MIIYSFRLSGICKHVAALMYVVMGKGEPASCTSVLQKWHHPTSKITGSAFLRDVVTIKPSPTTTLEAVKRKRGRDEFDPRLPSLQKKKTLADYDLDSLAEVSNGKAAILS